MLNKLNPTYVYVALVVAVLLTMLACLAAGLVATWKVGTLFRSAEF